jgi:hypothetical protein
MKGRDALHDSSCRGPARRLRPSTTGSPGSRSAGRPRACAPDAGTGGCAGHRFDCGEDPARQPAPHPDDAPRVALLLARVQEPLRRAGSLSTLRDPNEGAGNHPHGGAVAPRSTEQSAAMRCRGRQMDGNRPPSPPPRRVVDLAMSSASSEIEPCSLLVKCSPEAGPTGLEGACPAWSSRADRWRAAAPLMRRLPGRGSFPGHAPATRAWLFSHPGAAASAPTNTQGPRRPAAPHRDRSQARSKPRQLAGRSSCARIVLDLAPLML